jgi:hypothetical protein
LYEIVREMLGGVKVNEVRREEGVKRPLGVEVEVLFEVGSEEGVVETKTVKSEVREVDSRNVESWASVESKKRTLKSGGGAGPPAS